MLILIFGVSERIHAKARNLWMMNFWEAAHHLLSQTSDWHAFRLSGRNEDFDPEDAPGKPPKPCDLCVAFAARNCEAAFQEPRNPGIPAWASPGRADWHLKVLWQWEKTERDGWKLKNSMIFFLFFSPVTLFFTFHPPKNKFWPSPARPTRGCSRLAGPPPGCSAWSTWLPTDVAPRLGQWFFSGHGGLLW